MIGAGEASSEFPESLHKVIDVELAKKLANPASDEQRRAEWFRDKYGAQGLLDVRTALDEYPIDGLIGLINAGATDSIDELLSLLAKSNVYVLNVRGENPNAVMMDKGSGGEPQLWVFTRPTHMQMYLDSDETTGVCQRELSVFTLLRGFSAGQRFSIHLNPNGSVFDLVLGDDLSAALRNRSVRTERDSDAALNHIRNLLVLAKVDGTLDKSEMKVIHQVCKMNKVTEEEFHAILRDEHNKFVLPAGWAERVLQVFHSVLLMMADGEIHEKEMAAVVMLARALQFPEDEIDSVIYSLRSTIMSRGDIGAEMRSIVKRAEAGFPP